MTRVKVYNVFHAALAGERYMVRICKEICDASEDHAVQVIIHHCDECCAREPWALTRVKLGRLMREASEGTIVEFPEDEDV